MKIRDVMSRDAKLTSPDDTLRHAAQLMKECDCGVLPVSDGDRLVGMITDRDIAMRGIAEGKGPDTKVREAMTQEVMYCFEDEEAQHVCQNMADIQVRRLPVMNREKRLAAPAPEAVSSGTRPTTIAAVVIRIGRSLTRAARSIARRRSSPSAVCN